MNWFAKHAKNTELKGYGSETQIPHMLLAFSLQHTDAKDNIA